MNGLCLFFFDEFKGCGVQAVPQPRRPWSIGKNMAEVTSAVAADYFFPNHSQAPVGMDGDGRVREWLIEARPAGA